MDDEAKWAGSWNSQSPCRAAELAGKRGRKTQLSGGGGGGEEKESEFEEFKVSWSGRRDGEWEG